MIRDLDRQISVVGELEVWSFWWFDMGPIRGLKRKRQEKRAGRDAAAFMDSGLHEPSDWWDDFRKRITGPLLKDGCKFDSVFKISRKTFDYICSLVNDELMAKPSNFTCKNGNLLSVNDQVAIALRRLSSGESLVCVGQTLGINQSTVSQVTWRFVEAMEEKAIHHLRWPNSTDEMKALKSKFYKILGLPNCCGVIDTTHIMMCLPTVDSSNDVWIDYEKNHSMILQAVVDPNMRFLDIVTGWPGSMSESLVLRTSGFFKLCDNDLRLNGTKMEYSEGHHVREYVIGDAGFPLLPWLITPYQGKILPDFKEEFNRRHSAARMIAQRALARLKDTWKIIQGEMWRPDKNRLPRIILVCCLLHNIIIDLDDKVWTGSSPPLHDHDARYKQQYCNFANKDASLMRDELSRFLSLRLPRSQADLDSSI